MTPEKIKEKITAICNKLDALLALPINNDTNRSPDNFASVGDAIKSFNEGGSANFGIGMSIREFFDTVQKDQENANNLAAIGFRVKQLHETLKELMSADKELDYKEAIVPCLQKYYQVAIRLAMYTDVIAEHEVDLFCDV